MKSEDFIQLRLLLGTYVTAPFTAMLLFLVTILSGLTHKFRKLQLIQL